MPGCLKLTAGIRIVKFTNGNKTMKKSLAAIVLILPLAAYTQTQQGAAIGGLGGAAVGGAIGGTDGALIGGAAGAVGGALIGRAQERGQCVYEDRYGRRYTAAC
jgi:outer membrane lipoprotein SlyB